MEGHDCILKTFLTLYKNKILSYYCLEHTKINIEEEKPFTYQVAQVIGSELSYWLDKQIFREQYDFSVHDSNPRINMKGCCKAVAGMKRLLHG